MKKMWIVTIAVPTVVHDVLRQPIEGALTVSEDEAQRLHDNNLLVGDPEPVRGDEDEEGEDESLDAAPDDLRALKVSELKAKALKDGVPLNDATRRADIVAAFVKHRALAA